VRIIRKPLKVTPRKKLRSAAQRAAKHAEEDYSAEEPNVKLSRAFVVVLLLHIVAVGGIFAFSALKDHQTSAAGKAETSNQKGMVAPGNAARGSGVADKSSGKTVPADVQKLVEASHASGGGGGKTQNGGIAQEGSGETVKTYLVQRGDSPAGIAKKFKVSYADLLRTNNIEDPKKLQIGQKLLIP
jgi:LysM repeat protein